MKRLLIVFILWVATGLSAQAHVVRWWQGFFGLPNSEPLKLILYPNSTVQPFGLINVAPGSADEPCTVTVKLDPLDPVVAKYVSVQVVGDNPAKSVLIVVKLINIPPNSIPLQFSVTGTWAATGLPADGDCTAVMPNPFQVPVVLATSPVWLIQYQLLARTLVIQTAGFDVGLQEACSPLGPWTTTAIGRSFLFKNYAMSDERYYRGITRLGGDLLGIVLDPQGKPQKGVTLELPGGGAASPLDSFGYYQLRDLPYGTTALRISKPIDYTDPVSGAVRTENVGLRMEIPTTEAFTRMNYWFDAQAFPVSGCQYVGWSAIGLARINDTETWLYFDGGARALGDAPRGSSGVLNTVTPPTGPSFQIGRDQAAENYFKNPMPGDWKLTTTLCGQSRTLLLGVPRTF